MKKKERWAITEQALFVAFLFLFASLFLVMAIGYPTQTKFFPILVTVPLVIGLAVLTMLASRVPVEASGNRAATRLDFALTTGWMAGVVSIIWVIGLVPALFVIPVLYMRFYCRESWKITLVTGMFLMGFTFAFMSGLGIPMYVGVILETLQRAF